MNARVVLAFSIAACQAAPAPQLAPSAAIRAQSAAPTFELEPSSAEPVVAAATLAPLRATPGATLTLNVHLRTAPTWHIYAHDAAGGANTPLQLALELPSGIEEVGQWRHPPSHPEPATGAAILEGAFAFQRELRVRADAALGPRNIACRITYQACDPLMCRPPEQITVRAEATLVAR